MITFSFLTYGYPIEVKGLFGRKIIRIKLGDHTLTKESQRIADETNLTPEELVAHAQGVMRMVFTSASISDVYKKVLIAFMLLQLGGSLALAAAGLLLANVG